MRLRLALLASLLPVLAACDATGVERGGDPLVVDPCDATNGGHTWQDLYICYFGPTGKAGCAGTAQCHGDPSQAGAITPPGFFVCGATRESCWYGMTHANCPDAALPGTCRAAVTGTDATSTVLWGRLRGASGPGAHNMPNSSGAYTFTSDDLARISAWIQEGAQDN